MEARVRGGRDAFGSGCLLVKWGETHNVSLLCCNSALVRVRARVRVGQYDSIVYILDRIFGRRVRQ